MKDEHLTLAYELALSDVPTDHLCDEATFTSKAPNHKLSLLEREMIGSEASVIRGDETWDWVEPGTRVEFWTNDRYNRRPGIVQRIEPRITDGYLTVFLYIRVPGGSIVETYLENCRRPR
jgi:hypothetical protein